MEPLAEVHRVSALLECSCSHAPILHFTSPRHLPVYRCKALPHSSRRPPLHPLPCICIQMQGAAAFVETLDTSSLHVDPDLLLAHMLAAGAITDAEMEMMAKVRG